MHSGEPAPPSRPKIFVIGFNKCGTASITVLFNRSGVPTVHWIFRSGGRDINVAAAMQNNLALGRPVLHGVDQFIGYTDLNLVTEQVVVEGCRYYPALYRRYRDAYFVLNTRDVDRWIASRFSHGQFAQRYARALSCEEDTLERLWRQQFTRHCNEVRAFFARRPANFLEFDIEADDPRKLADFLSPHYAIDPAHWENRNPSRRTSAT